MRLSLAHALALAALILLPSAAQAAPTKPAAKPPAPAPLPEAKARMWLTTPSLEGPWTLRIDNEGEVGLRIPADPRLLRFEIEPVETDKKTKPVQCALPDSMRAASFPENRSLLLAPGESFIDTFDPALFCFGKAAEALRGGMVLHARFGWDPPKKGVKKPAEPPFAVESTERAPTIQALRELRAPSVVLGYGKDAQTPQAPAAGASEDPSAAPAPPASTPPASTPPTSTPPGDATAPPAATPGQVVDERAGRIELTAQPHVDASAARGVSLTVTATNTGARPITVALRPWMLSFQVDGPHGASTTCGGSGPRGSLPREAFQTLKPGGRSAFTVMLSEICPRDAFPRAGLYRVTATLSAGETSPDVEAYTADITAAEPTLLRLASGPRPFFNAAPQAIPASKPSDTSEE